MKYKSVPVVGVPSGINQYPFQHLKLDSDPYSAGVTTQQWMGGCGLGWIHGFVNVSTMHTWNDRAEWIAGLYRALYNPGNVIYSISSYQLKNEGHLALVELGAKQIAEFPNIYHGPSMITVWYVNIRDAVGRFCNQYGEAYESEGKVDTADINDSPHLPPKSGIYASIPVRKV